MALEDSPSDSTPRAAAYHPQFSGPVEGAVVGDNAKVQQIFQAPAPALTALHQLPPDIGDFVGREEEAAEVGRLLEQSSVGGRAVLISAIGGKPGVGKSALAIHVAHQLTERFPDAQLYVNLRGGEGQHLDPKEVVAELLRALGVEPQDLPLTPAEREALYRSQLANKRALILLDNAASSAQVRPLLPGSPSCAVLVTSRSSLGALAGAQLLKLEVMPEEEAVQLLAHLAGRGRVAAEPDAAREIVRLCGYLPLAVRIAGAKLKGKPRWQVKNLAKRLRDERTRLTQLHLEDLDVRAAFALSYADLTPKEQRVFQLLGLLPGLAAGEIPYWGFG